MAAILRRDRKATAEFVARFTNPVYAWVRSRLYPRTELADDLVQEVLLAAWEGLAGFRGDSSLEAWLMGIARHKVEDYYRSRLRDPDSLDEGFEDSPGVALLPDFDQMLDAERLGEKVLHVLSVLPESSRLVLLWRYWDKCSAREMALRTGKTEKAVERQLARAREQFKLRWKDG